MIDFFHSLYAKIKNKNSFLTKIRYYSMQRIAVRTIANILLPIYFRLTASDPNYRILANEKKSKKLIVSFTSFPKRIDKVWMVVESILRQSMKSDKIILWLSKEQFSTIESLPKSLLKLQYRGLTIRLCEGDIRSHKKYYYAMKEFPNDVIVTIDDDILYSKEMIMQLVLEANKRSTSIICRFGHIISWEKGILLPYNKWKNKESNYSPQFNAFFFGSGGGTLFNGNTLYKDILNIDLALELCPIADDIWLNSMARLNNTKIFSGGNSNSFLPIQYISNLTLASVNNVEGMNDKQIEAVRAYYIKTLGVDPFECKDVNQESKITETNSENYTKDSKIFKPK